MNREDKLKMFANEIGDIKDNDLRTLATEIIANADDYFFTVAASSSGKYHPQFDLGDGGLVRHTRCVAYMAMCMAESFDMSDYDKDALIVSALAHDIKKQGNGESSHTVWEHPTLASEYIKAIHKQIGSLVPSDVIEKIANAVHRHMGKWGNKPNFTRGNTPLPMPETEFEKALQAADYIASRKEILDFNFRATESVEYQKPKEVINEEKPVEEMSLFELENYVLPFGKHRGKTLREAKPTGYLEWMLKQTDFSNKYSQDVVRAYFDKLRESITSDSISEKPKSPVPDVTQEEIDNLPF